jgi:peptidase M48-like protein
MPQPGAGSMPLFVVDSDQAFIALSGIRRHRLLVTRGLVNALTNAELNAAIAHELGHRRAWDNLKRLAIRSAPDFLGHTRTAHELERRWASGAEHAADRAAGPAAAARCALASALVKVARLTPRADLHDAAIAAEPISTLISGGEIASRVRRLLDDPDVQSRPRRARTWLVGAASAALLVATYAPLLRALHETTERLIRILP